MDYIVVHKVVLVLEPSALESAIKTAQHLSSWKPFKPKATRNPISKKSWIYISRLKRKLNPHHWWRKFHKIRWACPALVVVHALDSKPAAPKPAVSMITASAALETAHVAHRVVLVLETSALEPAIKTAQHLSSWKPFKPKATRNPFSNLLHNKSGTWTTRVVGYVCCTRVVIFDSVRHEHGQFGSCIIVFTYKRSSNSLLVILSVSLSRLR